MIIKLQCNGKKLAYRKLGAYVGWKIVLPVYNLTLQTDGHGTLSADTLTGHVGDTSNLSYTANNGYGFSGYSIVGGGSIQNNTYTFGNEDGIVKAWFSALPLPANTLRLRFQDGVTPTNSKGTLTQVSSSPNVWDWTYNNEYWSNAWNDNDTLLEVIDAGDTSGVKYTYQMFTNCTSLTSVSLFDTSNVITMASMFGNCTSLTSVPLFNTSNVMDMSYMFGNCTSLTSVPLFNTSKATSMEYMFYGCYKVESGALALYQQASSQRTPPAHTYAFRYCGRDTTSGAAELAQIPSDWK